jgi:dTDP-4-dehydrorhamnose 3,5-epimerase
MTAQISGVFTMPLQILEDERGAVMHMLRADTPEFIGFGEVYFSKIKAGAIKAWKRHRLMQQSFAVPIGAIQLIIYDDRPSSETKGVVCEIITGVAVDNYELIRVPAMVWYGFSCIGNCESLIVNCSNLSHDPHEVDHIPMNSTLIPYQW